MAENNHAAWPKRWFEPTDEERADLERELQKELGPEHELKNRSARLIARRHDCDDALYQLDGGQVAHVHLTWAQHPETDPRWPACSIHNSQLEWREYWGAQIEPHLDSSKSLEDFA